MAEESSQEDRTEEATPYRLEEARRKGQVAQSKELTMALSAIAITVGFWLTGSFIIERTGRLMTYLLSESAVFNWTKHSVAWLLFGALKESGLIIAPIALLALVFGVLATVVQTGIVWSTEPLNPNWSKLDPMKGFKRIFGMRAGVEAIKSMAKFGFIGAVAYATIKGDLESASLYGERDIYTNIEVLAKLWFRLLMSVFGSILFIAIGDFMYQKFDYLKRMRMTKQEVKEELKQREGDPHIKSRIRSIQMQTARKRMFEEIPRADAIITNPTHISIAVRYDREEDMAPKVVAMGAGFVALKIREIARENGVPTVENVPLARALFKMVKLGDYIPREFYQAVAEILAFVYRIKAKNPFAGEMES